MWTISPWVTVSVGPGLVIDPAVTPQPPSRLPYRVNTAPRTGVGENRARIERTTRAVTVAIIAALRAAELQRAAMNPTGAVACRRAILNHSPICQESASISACPCSARRMAFESLPFDAQTHCTDVRMMGVPGFGAIYLIDDEEKALLETGTSNDARTILDAVRGFGLRPADIDHVIVSHIHLDHAGGAGFLVK